METLAQTLAHEIRDGIVQAHLRLGYGLNDAMDAGDAWGGTVEIVHLEQGDAD